MQGAAASPPPRQRLDPEPGLDGRGCRSGRSPPSRCWPSCPCSGTASSRWDDTPEPPGEPATTAASAGRSSGGWRPRATTGTACRWPGSPSPPTTSSGGSNPAGYHLTSLLIARRDDASPSTRSRGRSSPARAARAERRPGRAPSAAALLFASIRCASSRSRGRRSGGTSSSGLFFLLTVLAYVAATAATRRAPPLASGRVGRRASGGAPVQVDHGHGPARAAPPGHLSASPAPGRLRRWTVGRLRGSWPRRRRHAALSVRAGAPHPAFFRSDLESVQFLAWQESLSRVLVSLWFYPIKTPRAGRPLAPLRDARGAPSGPPCGAARRGGRRAGHGLAGSSAAAAPALWSAWTSYVIMLAPVAGALSLGYHLTADRYTTCPAWASRCSPGAAWRSPWTRPGAGRNGGAVATGDARGDRPRAVCLGWPG